MGCISLFYKTNAEVRLPGSVYDTCIFTNSDFSNKAFAMYYKELLPGSTWVAQLILGGPGYPRLPYGMKEFVKTEGQLIFNNMLRSGQNQIECAFGCLKARWRILLRPLDVPTAYTPNIILFAFYCIMEMLNFMTHL